LRKHKTIVHIPYKKQKRATTKVAQLHLLHQLHLFLVAYSLLSFITVITPLTPFTPKNGHTHIFWASHLLAHHKLKPQLTPKNKEINTYINIFVYTYIYLYIYILNIPIKIKNHLPFQKGVNGVISVKYLYFW